MSEETYYLSIGWDGARLHCADPDCEWSERVEGCDRLWGSWIDDTLTAHVEEVHDDTYALRCTAAITMKGLHYQCRGPQGHGGAHFDESIGAIWDGEAGR